VQDSDWPSRSVMTDIRSWEVHCICINNMQSGTHCGVSCFLSLLRRCRSFDNLSCVSVRVRAFPVSSNPRGGYGYGSVVVVVVAVVEVAAVVETVTLEVVTMSEWRCVSV
jgi:hypothetical protein